MEHDELREELAHLRERLERIEQRLQIAPPPERAAPAPPAPPAPPPLHPPPAITSAPPSAPPTAPPTAPPSAPRPAPPAAPRPAPPSAPPSAPRPAPPSAPPSAPRPAPPAAPHAPARPPAPPAARPPRGRPLELIIGGKLAAWVGAIALVISAALLVKLGIDSGFWGKMPASLRCLLVAAFGGALLVVGEVALRRISRAASVGLFGAGLGILYLDSFAASRVFKLVGEEMAFVLMAVVAAIGFAVTLRTRFRTIGVLSLVGGYLTPLLLWGAGNNLLTLVYLTALFAVALGLSAARPQPFRPLRYVGLGLQGLLGLVWLVDRGQTAWVASIIFISGWWAMVLAEAIFAALREQSRNGNAIATLLATAGYVTAGCWLLGAFPAAAAGGPGGPLGAFGPGWLGTFSVAVAVLGAVAALQFGSGLDGLRGPIRNAMDTLAVALWAQSAVLLAVAAALQFDGFGESVSWVAIAVASVEIGRRLPSRGADVFGLVVWLLALAHLAVIGLAIGVGFGPGNLGTTLASVGSVAINRWSLLVLLAVAASLWLAHRLNDRGPRPWRVWPVIAAVAAAGAWIALWLIQAGGLAAVALWTLGAYALLAAERFGRRQRYLEIAIVTLAVAGAHWLLVDGLSARFAPGWNPDALRPFLNGQMGLAIAIGAGGWWGARLLAGRPGGLATLAGWGPVAAALIVLLGVTFEIDRLIGRAAPAAGQVAAYTPALLRALWGTGLWALGAMGMIGIGRGGRRPPMVTSGWILLTLSGLAWLSFETLLYRFSHAPIAAPVLFNLQSGVGALLIVLFVVAARFTIGRPDDALQAEGWNTKPAALALGLVGLLGLWIGSLEIDRALAAQPTAAQAGLSVYWAIYGVLLVVVGFAKRASAARYAGLGLLALTVVKVLLVDLATVEKMWRVASFAVSGLLLIGTSVLYSKLSPRLLAGPDEDERERSVR